MHVCMMHKSMMRGFFVTNILSMGGAAAAGANRGTMRLGRLRLKQVQKFNPSQADTTGHTSETRNQNAYF